jgi:hypothetical protein
MPKILLSYRRADEIGTAARIFEYLCNYYGRNNVLSPDSEASLRSDFLTHIYDKVRDSDIVCVVIGSNWMGKSHSGDYLIGNDFDPVRLLIKEAINQRKILLPLLVDDGRMPSLQELPNDIQQLSYCNALFIGTGEQFQHQIERVVGVINSLDTFSTQASESEDPAGKPKYLILFMHGLGGEAQSTWGNFAAFLFCDPIIAANFDVAYYKFPTSLFRMPFSKRAPKIQELAAGLRSQIENRYAHYGAFALVCHSLGGLIARRYIIEEVKDKRPLRVKRLALFAVPNNGAALASIGQFISWRH